MRQDVRDTALKEATEIEALNAHELAVPSNDLPAVVENGAGNVPAAGPDPATRAEIDQIKASIDPADTQYIVRFGSEAQEGLQEISQRMLGDVRNKDVGPAGGHLRDMVTTLRGFSIGPGDARVEPRWWERLLRIVTPGAKLYARFEKVRDQIDAITADLVRHEQTLIGDIASLDQLYDRTLDFYHKLALFIAAGKERLADMEGHEIPALAKEAEAAADVKGGEGDGMMAAQRLRDLRAARDDLERRVHDLELTRQVTMQSLPSIRMIQENDKSLVTKINSTIVNTIPLWETQLAQALTIERSAQAARAVREAGDLTNDLLTANAENLRESNRVVREEMERGVFDIEAVQKANDALVATIEDSLKIAEEGKRRRAEADGKLQAMETKLRDTLIEARDAQAA